MSLPGDSVSVKKSRWFAAAKTWNSLSSQIVIYTVKVQKQKKNLLKAGKHCLSRLMVVNSSFPEFFILPYRISESQNEPGWEMQTCTVLVEVMLPSVWWSELPLFHYISKTSKGIKLVLDVVNQAAYSHHIHSFSLNTICQFLKWGGKCCLLLWNIEGPESAERCLRAKP